MKFVEPARELAVIDDAEVVVAGGGPAGSSPATGVRSAQAAAIAATRAHAAARGSTVVFIDSPGGRRIRQGRKRMTEFRKIGVVSPEHKNA